MRKEIIKETNYTSQDRPETRLAQFKDIFTHRFLELFKLSMLQAIFNMPLIVSLILFYILVRNSGDTNALMTVFLIQGVTFLVSMPSAFIGMTGTFHCMKKLAYAEGEYAASNFFIGLREEWKKGLLIGLLAGLSAGIGVIGFFFSYFYLPQFDNIASGFGIAIMVIQLIVVFIACYYSIAQVCIYSLSLKFILKNSFILTLLRFPHNLLCFILHPGILIALFCIMEITMYVGIALLVFFVAIGHLIWMLNVIASFDKLINKEQHPDVYRRGLKPIESNEEVQ